MIDKIIKYGLGIDVSKEQLEACFGALRSDYHFVISGRRTFDNTPSGFKHLLTWITKHHKQKDVQLQIVFEVTGVYHENALFFLNDKGLRVSLMLPKYTNHYMRSLGQVSKNDGLDGKGLCHLACHRQLRAWKPTSENVFAIRSALRHRKAMIKNRTALSNQVHALESGHLKSVVAIKQTKKLISHFEKAIQQVEKEIQRLAQADTVLWKRADRIIQSVKGLGLISVLTVVAETNGFEQFTSIKQLTSYAGYDIVENSSGKRVGKTKISKQGNARIRAELYMAALSVINSKLKPYINFYQRLLIRNGGLKKKANVAIQRKLLGLIFTLWKKEQAFNPEHHKLFHQQKKRSSDMVPELLEIDTSKELSSLS